MKTYQQTLTYNTLGRGTSNITHDVQNIVLDSGISSGLCHVFVQHTSASLMLCENADPDVRHDMETFMQQLVPDGDPMFLHQDEGPDDMSAHVRTMLTNPDVTIPVASERCDLGVWQGVYLWEHRTHPQTRRVIVTVQGC